jgi:hypothetical protein
MQKKNLQDGGGGGGGGNFFNVVGLIKKVTNFFAK